jgi:hypothetical protein
LIYQPVAHALGAALRQTFDPQSWRGAVARVCGAIGELLAEGDVSSDFSWIDLVFATLAVAAVVASLYGLVRAASALLRRRGRLETSGRAAPSDIDFYRRLEQLLARYDLLRPASQTQREFAHLAGGQLAESPSTQRVALLPRTVVEAFYRVRFGRQALDNQELQAVEQALTELSGALDAAQR